MAGSFLRALGRRLRELRREAKLSQEELAAAARISAKFVSEIETGQVNPSVEVLRAIAEKGLKIPLAALFVLAESVDEAQAVVREVSALLAAQPARERRRALRVLRALFVGE